MLHVGGPPGASAKGNRQSVALVVAMDEEAEEHS